MTDQYQKDQEIQKNAAIDLNIATTNKSKIDSAIGNLNVLLTNLQNQISASSAKLNQLQTQKQNLTNQASQTQLNSQQITQNIQTITNQIQATNISLTNNAKTCETYNSNLLQANQTLSIYNIQLGLVTQQISSTADDVINKKAVVDDLIKKLALAQ